MDTDRRALKAYALTPLQLMMLKQINRLKQNAYPTAISNEINDLLSAPMSVAQVYITLKRLEGRGLIRSHMTRGQSVRGGRGRRLYKFTELGVQVMEHHHLKVSLSTN